MEPTHEVLEGIIVSESSASGDLVSVKTRPIIEIFTSPGVVPALLAGIRQATLTGHKAELTTERGRNAIASLAFKVAKTKTYLDGLGKDEVARLKAIPAQVDASRKALRDGLDLLRDEIRGPLTQWEDRRDETARRIDAIKNMPLRLAHAGISELQQALVDLAETPQTLEAWGESLTMAGLTILEALTGIDSLLRGAQKREAEAVELEKLRAEKAERERQEKEEALRKEGAERERVRLEKIEAEKQAQPVSVAPVQSAPVAPPVPAAPVVLPSAPLPSANQAGKANREAMQDFTIVLKCDEEMAKNIVKAIVRGEIRNVTINQSTTQS